MIDDKEYFEKFNIEIHDEPEKALCDGPQALKPSKFDQLMKEMRLIAGAVGRSI